MMEARADTKRMIAAAIAYVELRSALAAAFRAGRIPGLLRSDRLQELEQLWEEVAEVPSDAALLRQAGHLADELALRGYDAVHLAALMRLGRDTEVAFACWDSELRGAARGWGID